MENFFKEFWPHIISYTIFVCWLMRLEAKVNSNNMIMDRLENMTCNLSNATNELRETVAELKGMIKGGRK